MKNKDYNYKSSHTFIFAFSWSVCGNADMKLIEHKIDHRYWEKYQFSIKVQDSINSYNDYSYFYEPVRDVLNLEKNMTFISSLQFQYKIEPKECFYKIYILDEEPLQLEIDDITLSLYENGIGIFTFHLNNYKEKNFNRILKINEYGRRIYPQFLGNTEPYTQGTKYNFLADKIELINVKSPYGEIVEDFGYYDDIDKVNKDFFHLPNHIHNLLGNNFTGKKSKDGTKKVVLSPIFDDRMFVVSHIFDDELLIELKQFRQKKNEYEFQRSTKWYRYIFVDDSSASCESKLMLKKQLTDHSYERWIEKTGYEGGKEVQAGQLFGVSRYSFVLLTGNSWFTKNIITAHMKTVYFELVNMCLLQRANVIYFGNEVAKISAELIDNPAKLVVIRKKTSALYLKYIKFINRIYFREITTQDQGIELYDMLQDAMKINDQVNDLDKEIQELNSYIEGIEQSNLSRIANLFLPATLFATIMGMNAINSSHFQNHNLKEFDLISYTILFASILVLIWGIILFINHLITKKFKIWK